MRCVSRHLDCDYSAAGIPRLASTSWEGAIVGAAQPDADSERLDMAFLDLEGTAAMLWDTEVSPSATREVARASASPFDATENVFSFSDPLIQSLDGLNDVPWLQHPITLNLPVAETHPPRIQEQASQWSYLAELSDKLFMTDFAAPPWPSPKLIPLKMRKLLSRKRVAKFGSTLTANYLISTIQSYPEMLASSNFPPFVHRYFADLTSDLPEPLANCSSFLPMFRGKTPASEKFVYKTLFLEVQRLHNEVSLRPWP